MALLVREVEGLGFEVVDLEDGFEVVGLDFVFVAEVEGRGGLKGLRPGAEEVDVREGGILLLRVGDKVKRVQRKLSL
jgi:hypothetical protein